MASWETTNLLTIGSTLLGAALAREETRGSHWREDFPDRDDQRWARHIDITLAGGIPRHSEVIADVTAVPVALPASGAAQ